MSLLNYSTPYVATPSPLYYQPSQYQTPPYNYPRPPSPFLNEDGHKQSSNNNNNNYPRVNHHHHHQQQSQHHHHHQQQEQDDQDNRRQQLHHTPPEYDDYYDDQDVDDFKPPQVTPIQGPIFLKNGTVPVVPLFSYPVINNGTFVQIPILWTALSVALGIEIHGEYIRGVPCIKTHGQLFCPTAGTSYPLDRIELFIDENKALMKRMYGEFTMGPEYGPGPPDDGNGGGTGNNRKQKRSLKPGVPDIHADPGPNPTLDGSSMFGKIRTPRQSFRNNQSSESNRVDACESKVEIVTPYWASNSAGKLRAIVNTQHFEQAIHQEICSKARTNRCSGDCGCEQKYKWHRLLAYDPDNDCKGIFMDWFLFPSCCVCRCNPT